MTKSKINCRFCEIDNKSGLFEIKTIDSLEKLTCILFIILQVNTDNLTVCFAHAHTAHEIHLACFNTYYLFITMNSEHHSIFFLYVLLLCYQTNRAKIKKTISRKGSSAEIQRAIDLPALMDFHLAIFLVTQELQSQRSLSWENC